MALVFVIIYFGLLMQQSPESCKRDVGVGY